MKLDVSGRREAALNRCLRPTGDNCHQTQDENYRAAEWNTYGSFHQSPNRCMSH